VLYIPVFNYLGEEGDGAGGLDSGFTDPGLIGAYRDGTIAWEVPLPNEPVGLAVDSTGNADVLLLFPNLMILGFDPTGAQVLAIDAGLYTGDVGVDLLATPRGLLLEGLGAWFGYDGGAIGTPL
jgi:hypothetical protein